MTAYNSKVTISTVRGKEEVNLLLSIISSMVCFIKINLWLPKVNLYCMIKKVKLLPKNLWTNLYILGNILINCFMARDKSILMITSTLNVK